MSSDLYKGCLHYLSRAAKLQLSIGELQENNHVANL